MLSEHAFDKLWELDLALGEFRALLAMPAEVIEETNLGDDLLKELIVNLHWREPLHLVVVVDPWHEEERVVTVYVPTTNRWSDNHRRRR